MKLALTIIIAVAIIALAYWWLIYKPSQVTQPAHSGLGTNEGSTCIRNGVPGTIKNGVCTPTVVSGGSAGFNG